VVVAVAGGAARGSNVTVEGAEVLVVNCWISVERSGLALVDWGFGRVTRGEASVVSQDVRVE